MSASFASADGKLSPEVTVGPPGVSGLWGVAMTGAAVTFGAGRTFSGRGVERGRPLLRFGG